MKKLQYILKQISKTNKKNYENYVITRIWHGLNSLDYKIITQQLIIRPDGKRAMTDLYFPQLDLHIEIDEKYHQKNTIKDISRENDIINITGHKILRLNVDCNLEEINRKTDDITNEIIKIRNLKKDFEIWNPLKEISTQTYIDKGYIDIRDKVFFDKIVDAINCFGLNYLGFQRGGINHPKDPECLIWFPKFYLNNEWNNNISDDENTIYEYNINENKRDKHIKEVIAKKRHTRIVFARVKDNLGNIVYKFYGTYKLNKENSYHERMLIWERINTRVNTFKI
jgi:hypothetical protein